MLAYLDYAASGPIHPAAAEAMAPWLYQRFGNPSGAHQVARLARAAIDDARDQVAELMGVEPGTVIFTSGGTEADNLAVAGVVAAREGAVCVSAVEHPAVAEAAFACGRQVLVVPVDGHGQVDTVALRDLLSQVRGGVALVSVQLANHETGIIQPLSELVRRVRKWAPGALVHTDAVQGAAWLPLADATGGADLISISGHKFGGPQGSGALGRRGEGAERSALRPILHGGGQEQEMRSGTPSVAAIVGLGAAAEIAVREGQARSQSVGQLRDDLRAALTSALDGWVETAPDADRVPGHLHLRFPGLESETLLVLLDEAGVCASAGAACASGAAEPSPVLLAMGVDKDEAASALRLTLGWGTTRAEVDHAATVIPAAVRKLRGF